MLVDLAADDRELWAHFFHITRDWYLNYGEIWLTRAATPDLDRLAAALRSSREWQVKTGDHWEVDFVDFSDERRSKARLGQVVAFRGKTHMQCLVEWDDTDVRVELCVWPPDLLNVSDKKFERMIDRQRVPLMPPSFPTVLDFARSLQQACDFEQVELAMEGDRYPTNPAAQ